MKIGVYNVERKEGNHVQMEHGNLVGSKTMQIVRCTLKFLTKTCLPLTYIIEEGLN